MRDATVRPVSPLLSPTADGRAGSRAAQEAEDVLSLGEACLTPLRHVRQDDLKAFLGSDPGVYVASCPDEAWLTHHGLPSQFTQPIAKKRRVFGMMAEGSQWLSPTYLPGLLSPTADWRSGPVEHLGSHGRTGRLRQLQLMRRIAGWLAAHRNEFTYILTYNFSPFTLPPALWQKLRFGKTVLVDYEDDYTACRRSPLKNALDRIPQRHVDGVVCVNEDMARQFPRARCIVVNAFGDFDYLARVPFRYADGQTYLYSGRLDDIRGIRFIPEIVERLRARLRDFTIVVTGDGPLRPLVESWDFPEVQYLGFLPEDDYDALLGRADACLVLQDPAHPFSRGSYPSKVEQYARHRKPILVIRRPPA